MASKTSTDWPGRRVDHSTFAAALAERRAAAGDPALPRNTGKRRTPSKKALLKAIETAGGKW
ncbi:hypothetical protein ACFO8O_01145 [Hephaestia sp. GCM10023244]|uniref:hypothetical protein n=1 Tax=unclassified Hephaestia TaxID=2631281 RepID=UPI0020778996|nr:hypothetical protein [Hephaestia sp. MAHUQ-44]MCM8729575.1 hypothetical protein [Hephaestia sp. MAHUQ-44]